MISIEEYNAVVDENKKLKKSVEGKQYIIDQLHKEVSRFINYADIYKNEIDIAINSNVRQKFKIASINRMFYYFSSFVEMAISDKITSEFKDKISCNQLNMIIRTINDILNDKIVEIVGKKCINKEPDEKCSQIFNFINTNDYNAIIQEKDDQINNLQKQLIELQHNNVRLSEEINKMLE